MECITIQKTKRKHEVKLWNVVAWLPQSSNKLLCVREIFSKISKQSNSTMRNKLRRANKPSENIHRLPIKEPLQTYIKIFLNRTLFMSSKSCRRPINARTSYLIFNWQALTANLHVIYFLIDKLEFGQHSDQLYGIWQQLDNNIF